MPATGPEQPAHQTDPEPPRTGPSEPLGFCGACGEKLPRGAGTCPECGESTVDKLLGKTIDDRYEVIRCLGRGAMGAVYEVRHLRLGKRFAMKVIRELFAKIPEFADRFKREAESSSRLKHPHCIEVTDFGQTEGGELYLVMEFLEGEPLSSLLGEPRAPNEALALMRQILLGLQHAHDAEIVHRDVKPENVMLVRGAEGERIAKLVDFGIAKASSGEAGKQITRAGMVVGTPEYMAPEQAQGAGVDARADLYAAGVILWEMLTGRPLFDVQKQLDLLMTKMTRPPPTLEQIAPGVFPAALNELLARAVARDPDGRFQTAEELLEALEEARVAVERSGVGDVPAPLAEGAPQPPATGGPSFSDRVSGSLRRVSGAYAAWYSCVDLAEPPSWRARLRGLVRTASGRVVLGSAIAALALIGVIIGGAASGEGEVPDPLPVPGAGSAAGAAKKPKRAREELPPEIARGLRHARDLLDSGACSKAVAALKRLTAKRPKLARAHYYLGAAQICRRYYSFGMAAYRRAIELDDRYRRDRRIRHDVARLLRKRKVRIRAVTLLAKIGKPALQQLLAASTHRSLSVRKRAVVAVAALGAGDKLDLIKIAALDLAQTRSCAGRRKVVARLRAIEDPRALEVLRKARRRRKTALSFIRYGRKHACIIKELEEAIVHLEQKLAR